MNVPGPQLDRLTHRLSECPAEFLAEPRIGRRGTVHVGAVVNDLMLDLGGNPLSEADRAVFTPDSSGRRDEARLILVAAWLLHDEAFRAYQGAIAPAALKWLGIGLKDLSASVAADSFVNDPDRREELARRCLDALGLRPAGETEVQSEDRLKSIDSVELGRVMAETRKQQERARELREQMRRKEAAEAAAKVSRE